MKCEKTCFDVDSITTSMITPMTQQFTHNICINDSSFFVESHGVSFAPQTPACDNETFHDLLGTSSKNEHAEDSFATMLGLFRENY